MAQVLRRFDATLSNVIYLQLKIQRYGLQLMDTDDVEWLLLCRFSTVRTLHVCQELAGHVALALEDITGEMFAEVLPHLDLIFLAGQPAPAIEKFVDARWLSSYPVTVIEIETEEEFKILKSYVIE